MAGRTMYNLQSLISQLASTAHIIALIELHVDTVESEARGMVIAWEVIIQKHIYYLVVESCHDGQGDSRS
jgi:hypothetical protein